MSDPIRVPDDWRPSSPAEAAALRERLPARFTIEGICANRRQHLVVMMEKMQELRRRSSDLIDRYCDPDQDGRGVLDQMSALMHEEDALIGNLIRIAFELAALSGDDHPTCPVCGQAT